MGVNSKCGVQSKRRCESCILKVSDMHKCHAFLSPPPFSGVWGGWGGGRSQGSSYYEKVQTQTQVLRKRASRSLQTNNAALNDCLSATAHCNVTQTLNAVTTIQYLSALSQSGGSKVWLLLVETSLELVGTLKEQTHTHNK